MQRMMWPAGQHRKVIADDKPLYPLRRLWALWKWRKQAVRESKLDKPIPNPHRWAIECAAWSVENPNPHGVAYIEGDERIAAERIAALGLA